MPQPPPPQQEDAPETDAQESPSQNDDWVETEHNDTNEDIFGNPAAHNHYSNNPQDPYIVERGDEYKHYPNTMPMASNQSEANGPPPSGDVAATLSSGSDWEQVKQRQQPEESTDYLHQNTNTGPTTLETVTTPHPDDRPLPNDSSLATEFEWVTTSTALIVPSLSSDTAAQSATSAPAASTAVALPSNLPPFAQAVTLGLQQLQEKSARRQHEVRTRIHALECQLAKWSARLAQERMARQEALQNILGEAVYEPAGRLTERVSVARQEALTYMDQVEGRQRTSPPRGVFADDGDDDDEGRAPRWRAVESRLSALETQMTNSAHALAKDRRQKLLGLHDRLVYDILPRLWKVRSAASAQESALLERVDQWAGEWTARAIKERATREAVMQTTKDHLQAAHVDYHQRHAALTTQLQEIRAELVREQQERRAQDALIQKHIVNMTTSLRNAVLAAVGDPEA